MSGLCFAALGKIVALGFTAFSLSWTHSVEKTTWREGYIVEGQKLRLDWVEVQGSGAGMEAKDGTTLQNGVWRWHEKTETIESISLRRSSYVSDYTLCHQKTCKSLEAWGVERADPTVMHACELK